MVVHPSGLLDALCEFFEVLWARALPLTDYLAERPGGRTDAPSRGRGRLLALLSTGRTHQAMARQLERQPPHVPGRLSGPMKRGWATTRASSSGCGLRARAGSRSRPRPAYASVALREQERLPRGSGGGGAVGIKPLNRACDRR